MVRVCAAARPAPCRGAEDSVIEGSGGVAFGMAAAVAGLHLAAPRLTFIRFTPRSWTLSASAGVSLAYVFVHLLPEVARAQDAVDAAASGWLASIERHAYVAGLVGIVVFYGLERAAALSESDRTEHVTSGAPTSRAAFWVSALSFAVYNVDFRTSGRT